MNNGVIMISWNHNLFTFLEKLNAVLLITEEYQIKLFFVNQPLRNCS